MELSNLIFLIMLIASAASMLAFGIYSRRFSTNPASLPYLLLMASAAGWSLTYALFLSTSNLQEKIFWQNIRFIFLPFLPVLELWLVLAFLKRDKWIAGWRLGILCIIPSISVLLALTSQYHMLFKYHNELIESSGFLILSVSNGAFFTVHLIYSYILIFTAFILVIFIHDTAHKIYRKQQILLCLALFTPVIISFLFDIGISPIPGINPTPAFPMKIYIKLVDSNH